MEETIKTKIGIIYKWKDKHYEERLGQGLNKREIETSEVRKKLTQIYPDAILTHKDSGEPLLKNTEYSYISISHCKGLFTFYLANEPVGIDIQYFRDSLVKGKNYFLNDKEVELELSALDLLLIWSAKEAFYKKTRGAIEDLRAEVTIIDVDTDENRISIQFNEVVEVLNLRVQENFVLVWT